MPQEFTIRASMPPDKVARGFRTLSRLAKKLNMDIKEVGTSSRRTSQSQRSWLAQAGTDLQRVTGFLTPIYTAKRVFDELFQGLLISQSGPVDYDVFVEPVLLAFPFTD